MHMYSLYVVLPNLFPSVENNDSTLSFFLCIGGTGHGSGNALLRRARYGAGYATARVRYGAGYATAPGLLGFRLTS
jgi:hypothetical protein